MLPAGREWAPPRPGFLAMFRCPKCHGEKASAAAACPKCGGDRVRVDETPTMRTKPRLLVLRPATKSADPRLTDPAIGVGSVPLSDPTPTPSTRPPRLRVIRGLKVH